MGIISTYRRLCERQVALFRYISMLVTYRIDGRNIRFHAHLPVFGCTVDFCICFSPFFLAIVHYCLDRPRDILLPVCLL